MVKILAHGQARVMWLGSSCCSYRLQIEAEGGVVDKTEIQKLGPKSKPRAARLRASAGSRPRPGMPPRPKPSHPKPKHSPAPSPTRPDTDTPGPALPGLEGVDLEAMLTKAEDALANLDEDISRHPRLAVLGALAVGLIIGSLLSR